jgi:hypothetical protein
VEIHPIDISLGSITVSRSPAMTIGALSRLAAVNIETIRFYAYPVL